MEHGFSYEKPSSGAGFYIVQVVALLALAGFLVGVQGLGWSRAVGPGRFGRWSLRVFQLGLLLLIIGGIGVILTGNQNIPVFPFGGLAVAIASVLTGIAVSRAGVWTGGRRFAPLLVGLYYVFGMLVPAVFSSGADGPPPALEIIWGAAWLILGLAYLVPSTRRSVATGAMPELTKARS